jgi:hypothetical protein
MGEQRRDMARHDPTSKETQTSYTESDVEVVMRQGDWRDWNDVIRWLETEGTTTAG